MIKKVALICGVFMLVAFISTTKFQNLVVEKLDNYTKNEFPEKIYIDTDKPYYTAGNDIWFSAYLINGITHEKSSKSNVVYVELINDKDSIVAQRKLYTNDISVAGDFKTDSSWDSGKYLLRGYTNYMRNNNPDYFFKKEIPIWNLKTDEKLNIKGQNLLTETKVGLNNNNAKINFYPEGGYLVEGIQSRVAIKVSNALAENTSGIVKDSDNKTISAFKTYKFGLGSLMLKPEPNKKYFAIIKVNGVEEKYELPKALPQGFNLNIQNYGKEIVLKATSTTPIGLLNTFLVIHQRGKIVFQKLIDSSKDKLTIKLNTQELSTGVTHVTLFNNNGKPVCERLVFIQNSNNNVVLDINKNNKTPGVRDKVVLTLDLKDKIGNPLSGNLSLAINDLETVQKSNKEDNIETYLLLNSDLRGEIENPGYFFEKTNESKRKFLLDLVMLTNGWSRFKWQNILYNPPRNKNRFEIEKGVYISGQTQDLKDRSNFISAPTRITFLKEIPPYQELSKSNENGQFKFGPYVLHDSVSVIVESRVKDFKSKSRKNSRVHISIRKNIYKNPIVKRKQLLKNTNNIKTAESFIELSKKIYDLDTTSAKNSQRLKEVVIKVKKEREIEVRNKTLDSLTDYGSPSRRLDISNIAGGESLSFSSLLRRLPGVVVTNNSIMLRGRSPRIFLDDFLVEFEDVISLSGSDIEFIDLLTGANASFFSGSANGIIVIYSKINGGAIKNTSAVPGIINFDYQGFYSAREFYAPDHSDNFIDFTKKDIRTTLHWEPKIIIKEDSKVEVPFYTSDIQSDYAIEIEGITNSGIPIYQYETFSVE